MRRKIGIVSGIALWSCMIFLLVTAGVLYWMNVPDPLLYCFYIMFGLTIVTSFLFSVWHFFRNRKQNPRAGLKSLCIFLAGIVFLAVCYLLGDGTSPSGTLSGSERQISFFLKWTDMWLYALYVLLGITVFGIIGGIIWSYIKSRDE